MWSKFIVAASELGFLLFVTKLAYQAFYNIYRSPLKSFPGPLLYAISALPFDISGIQGTRHKVLAALHDKYGPVVRVGPNELTYIDGRVWKDAYTVRPGHQEWEKSDVIHALNGVRGIIASLRPEHRRFRRSLAHAFSRQGLKEQEPIIQHHVEGMVAGISERHGAGLTDIGAWLSWTTTDIIGDLAFGDSFGCVDSAAGHHFVESTLNLLKPSMWMGVMSRRGLGSLALAAMPKKMAAALHENADYVYSKLRKRINLGRDRGDFFDHVLKHGVLDERIPLNQQVEAGKPPEELLGFTFEELHSTASEIVFAGSETTATVLSGVVFNLLLHPEIQARLTAEVRSAFATDGEITMASIAIGSLPYLDAVLQEGLRIYHPAPLFAGRVAPPGGDTIAGVFLPEGTRVSCPVGVAAISEYNFAQPKRFAPERWLRVNGEAPEEFCEDNKGNIFQPFSYGTRNCIGLNLAQAEMHLILAKILWHFDMSRPQGSEVERKDWEMWVEKQRVWFTWQKGPLMVDVKPRDSGHENVS
ncbi:unnamed protein product [Discula destructiva]